jgi:hypothetical protein
MQTQHVRLHRSRRAYFYRFGLRYALPLAAVLPCAATHAAPLFTPGDIVVTRAVGGDVDTSGGAGSAGGVTNSTALTGNGVAASVEIDEYAPTGGAPVLTLMLPNVVNNTGSGNRALTFSGTQTTEGAITLSGDGNYFVVAGYNATACSSTSSPNFQGTNGVAATTTNRVVGLIDMNGNVNTTTALSNVANSVAFRSAYSTDGTNIWVNGQNGGATGGGVQYTTVGSTTSTQLTGAAGTTPTNQRVLNGFNGQLYISHAGAGASNGAIHGIDTVGTGFPTSTGTLAQLVGFGASTTPTPLNETADDYWFKDANTLYVADNRADGTNGGLQKWVFTDTNNDSVPDTWVYQYNVILPKGVTNSNVGAHGLTGAIDSVSGDADLFVTSFDGTGANANSVYSVIDLGTAFTTPSLIATSATNSAFRGVEIVPGGSITLPIPEPTTLSMLGIVALGLIRRRREV